MILFIQCGLLDQIIFPFHNWKHFHRPAETTNTYYIIRLIDSTGEERRFGYRMLPDDIFSVGLNSYIRDQLIDETVQGAKYEEFILKQANRFINRESTPIQKLRQRLKRHRAFDWSYEKMDSVDEIVGIRIYKSIVEFKEDGKEILSHIEKLLYETSHY